MKSSDRSIALSEVRELQKEKKRQAHQHKSSNQSDTKTKGLSLTHDAQQSRYGAGAKKNRQRE